MIEGQIAGPIGDKRYAEFAGTIHTAGNQLLGLINSLLDLSKIEAGRFALSEEPVILTHALVEMTELCRPLADAKQIALTSFVMPECEAVYADPGGLRQILLNLLSNAIKFTPGGGKVEVGVRRNADGELVVTVQDTGTGISPADLARLFVPFERLHQGSATEGAGLGLCITRGLVDLHGGGIRLESELGQGTTVIVTLPANRLIAAAALADAELPVAAE
jgi:two-component system cell cycle sensor histidine kinase PleC